MRFDRRSLAVFVGCVAGCVVSSGTGDPPTVDNALVIDGEAVDVDAVVVEVNAGGGEFADARRARVSGRAGEFTLRVSLDSFDAGDRDVVPFGRTAVVSTDGPEAEHVQNARSGVVRVVSGDGSVGSDVVVEVEDVVLVDACSGVEQVVDRATFVGAVQESELATGDDDPGFVGFIDGDLDAGASFNADAGGDHVIGIVGGSVGTFTDATPFFRVETSDACASRPHPLAMIVAILPEELPAPGTTVAFSSLRRSAAFLFVLERPARQIASATLVSGDITVNEAVSLDDGAVFDADIENAAFVYVDADDNETDDPQATSSHLHLHAILGRPEL